MVNTVTQTAEVVTQTAEVVGQVGDGVTRLANVTHAGFTDVNAKINALIDAQIRTEENRTNFIAQVDRRFREDRNSN
jgi:hypothetical protein